MSPQTRFERYEHRTEWALVARLTLAFLALYSVRVLAKPDGGAERTGPRGNNWRVIDDQANCGVGHRICRKDGHP